MMNDKKNMFLDSGEALLARLRTSELNYRTIIENSLAGFFIIQDEKFKYVSKKMEAFIGAERLKSGWNETFIEFIHPDDQERVSRFHEARLTGEECPDSYTFRAFSPNGKLTWIALQAAVTEYNGKKAIMGSVTDVTDQCLTEQRIISSEARYHSLFESANDAIMIFVDGEMVDCNAMATKMFDASRQELIVSLTRKGNRFSPEFQPDGQPSYEKILGIVEHVKEKGPLAFEWRYRRGDGSEFDGSVHFRRVDVGDNYLLQCVVHDLSERKQAQQERALLEAQLRQQQKLESIGTLASGVAHEINNPITGIMNYAELMDKRLAPDDPLRNFAKGIVAETERVARIVRNLLSFARQEQESHEPVDIKETIENTLSLIRTFINKDQINLEVKIDENLPKINCRSQQIQQVLMNLMTNARDALNERYHDYDPKKTMRVAASFIKQEDEPCIKIEVEDLGTGISPSIKNRIFDPFFTTKPRHYGTGLGLSVSHGIITEHGGEISFETQKGEFTRFIILLKVNNPRPPGTSDCVVPKL